MLPAPRSRVLSNCYCSSWSINSAATCFPLFSLQSDPGGPQNSDYSFDEELLSSTRSVVLEGSTEGATPRDDIFDRPIIRTLPASGEFEEASKEFSCGRCCRDFSRHKYYPIKKFSHCLLTLLSRLFCSALLAVQPLSFGSIRVRRRGPVIDEIQIANNIASSAKGGDVESYNYRWTWKNRQRKLSKQRDISRDEKNALGLRVSLCLKHFVPNDIRHVYHFLQSFSS